MPRAKKKSQHTYLSAFILAALALVGGAVCVIVLYGPAAAVPTGAAAVPAEHSPESHPAALIQAPEPLPGTPPHAVKKARLMIIIDDAGYDLARLAAFLRFPAALSVAVLPGLPASAESARRVSAAGKCLILHQPMQAVSGQDPGPGALTIDMTEKQAVEQLEKNLAGLPGAAGMNNHMGSLATADERLMRIVLGFIASHNMVFIDSRTTGATVVPRMAAEMKSRHLSRHVFLDNDRSLAGMRDSLERGRETADREGTAVLIGHVWSDGLAALLIEDHARLSALGYRFLDAFNAGDG